MKRFSPPRRRPSVPCQPALTLLEPRRGERQILDSLGNGHPFKPGRNSDMRLRSLVCIAILLATALPAHAQDVERSAVLATVQKVFDAMRTRDTALLRQAFDTSARLAGVSTRGGPPTVRLTAPTAFGAAIASAPAGDAWTERIGAP